MDTTHPAAALPTAGAPALPRLGALPGRTQATLAVGSVLLAGLIAAGVYLGNQPEWRVLYGNLGDKDGGQVIAALSQMNVPHRFSEGGGAILVPAAQVHEARLRLASQGLPRGGTVGFELMENQKFGTTQFQERLNFQRGLEGELARSIMALSAVQSARVHLALPQQTGFMREQQRPSASVLLTLFGGRTLDRGQIAGIVHLVASSVPQLHPGAVSVVDQTGALLSQTSDNAPGLDAGQLHYVRQMEQGLAARIVAIVEPLVGPGNVKAQVTADIDFTQVESTAETYGANQGASPAAVRSQHLSETPQPAAASAGGIPGALSNQPAPAAASPVNGPAQALSAGPGASAAAAAARRDAVTNYEVDKTVKVVRNPAGTLRRLSAAVVINDTAGPDAPAGSPALNPQQVEQVRSLVREAIGFNTERGDSVNVVNAPFKVAAITPPPTLPLWRQPETRQLVQAVAPWIALPLLALAVLFGLVRPALRSAQRVAAEPVPTPRLVDTTLRDAVPLPEPGKQQAQPAAPGLPHTDPITLLPPAEAAAQQQRTRQLENIRSLAKQNPATVANVVRSWSTG
ncbi:flagellar M-ring protein FliF [Ramlibacter sp. AW1]|uniref:Flagellar M-ring protein n=1 Tax=Ramlibacter aurantiacus TaxID=2801330 RepID=A0A936ZQ15_9BURK|nr:flagellar basal-body MS-ring/collar protein FliF [Ramlibacter aurantiacus]MBL0421450.1 flagellar M-ring protein FliF [Ramlibacter aurantiacus]